MRSTMKRLWLVLATTLMLHIVAAPVGGQTTTVTLTAVPESVQPGGRLGYRVSVFNQGTAARNVELELDYDADVEPQAWDAFCDTGTLPPDCNVVEEEPATRWTLASVASGEIRILRIEVLVDAMAPVTDPETLNPRLSTTATAREILSGGATGSVATATATTRVSDSASSAPFLLAFSAQPEPVHPGEDLAYRITVVNAGAEKRDIDLFVDYAAGLGVPDWATDHEICAGHCSAAPLWCQRDAACAMGMCASGARACRSDADCDVFGLCLPPLIPGQTCVNTTAPASCEVAEEDNAARWTLRSVEPGMPRVLLIQIPVPESLIRTRIESTAVVTDTLFTGTVRASATTTVSVCDGATNGDPCDDGDGCPGDTCQSERCHSVACSQTCIGAADRSPCTDGDLCTLNHCIDEECVLQRSGGSETGDPLTLPCASCETCDPLQGCVLDPEKTGEECRPAFLPCDAAEFCDGANGACPVDVDKPDGTACDDLDSRTVHDVCMAGLCAGDSHPCGNGALDGGEACDDGGSESGDCCSPTCEFEAAGSPCPDDDMCNGDETCDGAGTCEAGTPPDCDDESVCTADFCDPATGCVFDPDPAVDCADEWERASLLINESRQGREKLMLKLSHGPALTRADFGGPVSGATAYTVCFYREDTGAFAGDVTVDRTGSRCGRRDCWKQVGRWSYRYSDGAYATDGVGTIKLIGGKAGRSRIEVHGRNQSRRAQLSLPAISEGLEHSFGGTRVQIRPSDAPTCFEANLGRVMRTGPTYFKAEN